MRVSDLTVHAVVYAVRRDVVSAVWLDGSQARETALGSTVDVLDGADALRDELRRTVDLAAGSVPLLERFMGGWGRALLPPELLADMPDVLVLVPHALLHDLPLHLIRTDGGSPVGTVCGVAFCGGMSLFTRCASRNASRHLDPAAWRFEEDASPVGHRTGRRLRAGGIDVTAVEADRFAELARIAARHFEPSHVDLVADDDLDRLSRGAARSCFVVGSSADDAPDVGCVVAHGWVDPEQHQLSGLLLAAPPYPGVGFRDIRVGERHVLYKDLPLRAPPPQRDHPAVEMLTAAELELDAESASELVFLLGCSAGWGRQLQADEPASFAETLLRLGVASVVAPLWDAHIDATRDWLDAFLGAWARGGKPKALAARDATGRLYERYGPERAGALTLRGDWL